VSFREPGPSYQANDDSHFDANRQLRRNPGGPQRHAMERSRKVWPSLYRSLRSSVNPFNAPVRINALSLDSSAGR
jgi:hypothetical protein